MRKTTSASSAAKDYAAIATQYALDVTHGRILACKLTRAACARHLSDLERAGSKNSKRRASSFPYYFDADAAGRACRFIEKLPHVKGKWARKRETINLEPWQVFFVCSIFGWLRIEDGMRRFRRAYLEVPRKNAKSTIAAGIGLYCAFADKEEGAEVYCGATSEDQAWEVFRPAKLMVERTPKLQAALGVKPMANSIISLRDASIMEPVIGKPGDGASPHCAIVDEYHEHATSELIDTMDTGMGARDQPLLLVITTAGVDLAGPCRMLHLECETMLNGIVDDPELFALIYTIDEGDDWTTEEALIKANPNAGVSVRMDYLRSQQKIAIRNAHKSGIFKTKHLNVWVAARSPFFNIEAWEKDCKREGMKLEDYVGAQAIVFLDLASKKDLATMQIVLRIGNDYKAFSRFWLPEDRIEDVKSVPYAAWRDQGYLTATPGNLIDFEFIEEDLRGLLELGIEIKAVGYDPFQATQFATRMLAEGFPMVEYGQTVKNFSEPMKETDRLILAGRLHHDGNPVQTWCMSNVTAKVDAKDNVFPRKEKDETKIDGAVALIGAIGLWMGREVEEEEPSFFVAL